MYSHPAGEGDGFTVWFIHSVNQSPVAEIFVIYEEKFYLTAYEFDGGMHSVDIFTGKTELRYMVGRATDFVLYIEDERVKLAEVAEPGTLIEFSIRRGHF